MSSPTLAAGTKIGPYTVEKLIGKGGMGEVYLATEENLRRKVALKFVSPEMARNQDVLNRFQLESRALALINHANVVGVFGVGETEFGHYIAMEYIDGKSVSAIFKNIVLPAREAVPLFCQMIDGIRALHQRSVVHRDLKPQNIIYQKDNVMKIVDLGIAKVYDGSSTTATATGVLIGTIKYLAPEVAAGRPATAVSDIWSLGAIFYEMLCGTSLIFAPNQMQAFAQLAQFQVRFPPDAAALIPKELQTIIERMCAKAPEDRYRDTKLIRQDLENFMAKNPSEAKWQYRVIGKEIKNAAALKQQLVQKGFSEFAAKSILFQALNEAQIFKQKNTSVDATLVMNPQDDDVVLDSAFHSAVSGISTGFRRRSRNRHLARWAGAAVALAALSAIGLWLSPKTPVAPMKPVPVVNVPAEFQAPPPPVPDPKPAEVVPPPSPVAAPAPAPAPVAIPVPVPAPAPVVAAVPAPAPPKPKPVKPAGPDFAVTSPKIHSKSVKIKFDSDNSSSRPQLEWETLANAESYSVQIAKTPDFAQAVLERNLSDTAYNWTSATPGRYFWRVRGTNSAGRASNYSEPGEIDLRVNAPKLPKQVEWSSVSGGAIAWTASPVTSSYRLVVARDPAFADLTETRKVTGTEDSVKVPEMGTYYARVVAMNADGIEVSEPSNPMKVIVKQLLAAPTLVSPPKSATLMMSNATAPLLLFWNQVDKAQEYQIELAASENFQNPLLTKTSKVNRYTHKSRLPKGRVYWRIRALSPEGPSLWSETRHFEVQ
jgi:serine/threonine protein kinase